MTQPNLIHPVPITIQQLVKDETLYDEDYREPVQQSVRTQSIEVPGQVRYGSSQELGVTTSGPKEGEAGYVLFRYRDLAAASVTLQQNDRFTKIGNEIVDVYVTRTQPIGHYPSAGGATLVKAFFTDRQPSRQGLAT